MKIKINTIVLGNIKSFLNFLIIIAAIVLVIYIYTRLALWVHS
jgi:hypothetical protein